MCEHNEKVTCFCINNAVWLLTFGLIVMFKDRWCDLLIAKQPLNEHCVNRSELSGPYSVQLDRLLRSRFWCCINFPARGPLFA